MRIVKLLCALSVIGIMLSGCGTFDKELDIPASSTSEAVTDNQNGEKRDEELLEQKCRKIKKNKIGAELSRLLYASETVAVILDESSIIVYDIKAKQVSDVVLLKNNAVMGDVFLQGDKASSISASKDGRFIIIRQIMGDNHYKYELATGEIQKLQQVDEKTIFESYEAVKKSKYLPGVGKRWYLCGEDGIQINREKYMYLINTNFKTLKGLTLVQCEGKEKIEIPVW